MPMRFTLFLIGVNVAVFSLQALLGPLFSQAFELTPNVALSGAWWQFLTYMFMHANPTHLFFNMFILFLFGEVMEHALGWQRYIMLYVVAGLGAALAHIALMQLTGMPEAMSIPLVGASGSVFGIIAAYGLIFPNEKIWFFVPLPAFTVVILLGAMEFVVGFLGIEQQIANFGHLGGLVTGVALTYLWKRTIRPKGVNERRAFEFFWE